MQQGNLCLAATAAATATATTTTTTTNAGLLLTTDNWPTFHN